MYLQAKISPDGHYIAYVTNELGQIKDLPIRYPNRKEAEN